MSVNQAFIIHEGILYMKKKTTLIVVKRLLIVVGFTNLKSRIHR